MSESNEAVIQPNAIYEFTENVRNFLVKGFLTGYRWVAVCVLYFVVLGVLGFMVETGFYLVNWSWVVPTIISPTNDKILDLKGKIVMSEQSLEALKADRVHQATSVDALAKSVSSLYAMDASFQKAIGTQQTNDKFDMPQLLSLNVQKQADNVRTSEIVLQLDAADKQVDADLKAGLITRLDAINTKASINQLRSSLTDSKVTALLLSDNAKQKDSNLTVVNALAQEAEVRTGIIQLQLLITNAEQQVKADDLQINQLQAAIETAKTSPYFLATQGRVQFAFVPYANSNKVAVDEPVYDCYLNFIACRQVGTIEKVFSDEETVTHPIWKTDLRGSLIQLNLTNMASAKSQTLFVGRKPLGF